MNIEFLKDVVADQQEEMAKLLKGRKIIEREMTARYSGFVGKGIATVVMGVRRSGKSVFSHQLLGNREYQYVNFDDERLRRIKAEELNDVLKAFYELYGTVDFVLLDEVQNVDGWELFVNRLLRNGINVLATGSNSKLLSKELSTHLTGRYIQIELFPFSYREFLRYDDIEASEREFHITEKVSMIKRKLEEYIKIGGFPEVAKERDMHREYLSTLYHAILSKDVVTRYNIRLSEKFKDLSNYLISNPAELISFNRLKSLFDLKSTHTAMKYVSYLKEAYLIFPLDGFSFKSHEVIRSQKKIYPIDTGLVNAIGGPRGEKKGRLMECAVAIELLRRKAPDTGLYYWRDYQQHEVDFVVRKGADTDVLIQVCYDVEDKETRKREVQGLLKANKEIGGKMLVITWDFEGKEIIENREIKYVPLYKWLIKWGQTP